MCNERMGTGAPMGDEASELSLRRRWSSRLTSRKAMAYTRDTETFLSKLLRHLPERQRKLAIDEIKRKLHESFGEGQRACPICNPPRRPQ